MNLLARLFRKKTDTKKNEAHSSPPSGGAEDFKQAIEEQASRIAKEQGWDFSIASLQAVDEFLENARAALNPEKDMPRIVGIANAAGHYIFEVARRLHGGSYYGYGNGHENLVQPILVIGQPDFEVGFLAMEKAKGRILNGSEDSIPFYFQGLEESVQKGRTSPGYKALLV